MRGAQKSKSTLAGNVAGLLFLGCAAVVAAATPSPDLGIPWLYKGLAVWAFAWGALDAFGIGANDVANSFANAIAAKTVTFSQAVAIACVAEFVGCIGLGKNVTDTIRTKIVSVDYFVNDPYMLMLGMSTTSIGSSTWVLAATYLGMPVSTTHATVGAVMGIGIAAFGVNGVNWAYNGGFGGVVASWFISPAVAGVLSAIIYISIKYLVLQQPNEISFNRGIMTLPIYSFITFGIVTGFMIFKGIPIVSDFSTHYEKSIPTVFGIGIGMAIITALTVVPWVRRFISDNENLPWWTIPTIMCVPVGKYGYYEEGTHDLQTGMNRRGPKDSSNDGTPVGNNEALQQMVDNAGTRDYPSVPASHQGMPPPQPMPYGMPPPGVNNTPPGFNIAPPGYNMYAVPYPQQAYGQRMPFPSGNATPVQIMGAGLGQRVQVVGNNFGLPVEDPIKVLDEERPRINGVPMYHTTNDTAFDTFFRRATPGFYIDIDALCDECHELHAHANHYYDKTERLYKVLQISTCFFMSLAHGANDVANAVGPLSAVWAVYSTGLLNKKSPVEVWILAYGGLWLDIGLIVFGHNIMMVLGNKVTYQTPSRGFCIELGAMFSVLLFSKLGVPVSTTHCVSGSTAAVGLCNGNARALNWRLVLIICLGWIITCPAAGIVTGLIFWGFSTTPHPVPGNGFFGN